MVGQSLGAKKPDRAQQAVWRAALYNVDVLGVVGVPDQTSRVRHGPRSRFPHPPFELVPLGSGRDQGSSLKRATHPKGNSYPVGLEMSSRPIFPKPRLVLLVNLYSVTTYGIRVLARIEDFQS
jgi:hypothetical protein